MDSSQSQALNRRAVARDRAALDELFAHYGPLVRKGLRRRLGER